MPTRIVPKKYLLTPKDRVAFSLYLRGDIGSREAGKMMSTNHQSIHRIVASIFRHAVETKQVDIETLLRKY
jgi:hypothetical protein